MVFYLLVISFVNFIFLLIGFFLGLTTQKNKIEKTKEKFQSLVSKKDEKVGVVQRPSPQRKEELKKPHLVQEAEEFDKIFKNYEGFNI